MTMLQGRLPKPMNLAVFYLIADYDSDGVETIALFTLSLFLTLVISDRFVRVRRVSPAERTRLRAAAWCLLSDDSADDDGRSAQGSQSPPRRPRKPIGEGYHLHPL